jgi:hypothetical protein
VPKRSRVRQVTIALEIDAAEVEDHPPIDLDDFIER